MARFHTLYTAIEVTGPLEAGLPMQGATFARVGRPFHSKLLGRFGETQVFPTYLGVTGLLSLVCGFIAIEIIGLNFANRKYRSTNSPNDPPAMQPSVSDGQ